MKLGTRQHEGASLRVKVATGLPKYMRGEVVELCEVHSSVPRQGHADALLASVALEADLARKLLFLSVKDGEDREWLARWYARHGFVPIQAEPLLMVRPHIAMRAH